MMTINLKAGDALMIVDVQRDFLAGGALAVPAGDNVVAPLNAYVALAQRHHLAVYASRDWHPPDHGSFKSCGGSWPVHCVAGSAGAQFADDLRLPAGAVVIDKGCTAHSEGYSAFEDTGLARRLRGAGVTRLLVGGLATDYCVFHTVRDALHAGFEVLLLTDAIRAVDVHAGDGEHAVAEMTRLGARPAAIGEFAP
jgi:nicotinamidase/pyrazinamidase